MELPSKLFEQTAFNTRPKIEEDMMIVMDKPTHDEHQSQPIQPNNKQFKNAVTILTGYNGILNVINSNNRFCFMKSISDGEGFIRITIPPGVYEIESLNKEIKRLIIDEGYFTEANYQFTIKPNFATLGSILEISPQGPIINLIFRDIIKKI